jgi:hypothetical protein
VNRPPESTPGAFRCQGAVTFFSAAAQATNWAWVMYWPPTA